MPRIKRKLSILTLQQRQLSAPRIGTICRHYKGDYYEVVDVAIDHETMQPVIVYTPTLSPDAMCELFIRSRKELIALLRTEGYSKDAAAGMLHTGNSTGRRALAKLCVCLPNIRFTTTIKRWDGRVYHDGRWQFRFDTITII